MKKLFVFIAIALSALLPLMAATPSFFIDYVEFGGSTYLDTEVVGRSGTRAEIDLQFLEVGGDLAVLDARKDTGSSRFYMFHSYLGKACLGYGDFIRRDSVSTARAQRYLVHSDLRAGSQTVELDGNTIYAGTDAKVVDTEANLYLGACNPAYQEKAAYHSKVRIFGLKLWQTATTAAGDTDYVLVRDFRPCLVNMGGGTYYGALYDQVSGRVFTGRNPDNEECDLGRSNVWGSRVRGRPDYFVEYVESTGGQVLDTGVPAREGVAAEGDFAWTGNHDSEQTFLGNTTYAAGQTCYMIHRANNKVWLSFGDVRGYPVAPGTGEETTYAKDERKHHFHMDLADKSALSLDLDGQRVFEAGTEVDVRIPSTLTLFAARRANSSAGFFATARCYGLKMWLDGALVRDFRPCVRDGRAGLYDAVNGEVVFPMGELPVDKVGPAVDAVTGAAFQFVEYVESGASQYVDTGVVGRSGTKIEADFAYQGDTAGDNAFIGCRPDAGDTRFFPFHNANSSYCYGYAKFVYAKRGELPTGTRHVVVSDMRAGCQTLDVDGARVYAASDATELDTGVNLYLFAVNYDGPKYAAKCRCYGLKIWQTATTDASDADYALVRDFVPCRVNQGIYWTGALYDRVSGTVFPCQPVKAGNAGLLGLPPDPESTVARGRPDAFLEYVQSDGRQLIDTDVAAESGIRAAGEFAWMESLAPEQTYLGSYAGNRVYLVHQAKAGKPWLGYGNVEGHRGYVVAGGTAFVDADAAPAVYAAGARHAFDVTFKAGEQAFALDGVPYLSTAFPETIASAAPLTLFGVHMGLNGSAYAAKARCYGLKLWKDDVLVRDFRPCLKNGRVGLYDAVRDEVVFSSFVDFEPGLAGPVVDASAAQPRQRLDYLGSDGSAWLDTGVVARSGTRTEVEFAGRWSEGAVADYFGADMGLLGARTWCYGETRLYPVHVLDGALTAGYGVYTKTAAPVAADAFHVVRTDYAAGHQTITLDGEQVYAAESAASVDTGLPLYLFAANIGGEAQYLMPARVRRVRIWQQPAEGGAYALVRDLQPVLADGGLPAFYDAVSRTCLFSSRAFTDVGPVTGSFTKGMVLIVR